MHHNLKNHESEAQKLLDEHARHSYEEQTRYSVTSLPPRWLAWSLFFMTDLCYGRAPSLKKFYVIEIIARIPYQSWELWSYIIQTLAFAEEQRAIKLGELAHFSRVAQDNETMHVVALGLILGRRSNIFLSIPAFILSFFYFQACFVLHAIHKSWAYELNYLFENHAFQAYQEFLQLHDTELKTQPLASAYLTWYGRDVSTVYDFLALVRNDELLHRHSSISLLKQNLSR